MLHLMVDTETFGTNSNAPVIEVSVVQFNDMDVLDCFTSYVYPDFTKSMPDVSTIAWWHKQTTECPLHEDAPAFPTVLHKLGEWLGQTPIDGVWANAPSFDLVILHNLAHAYGLSMPWGHREYRCMRTLGVLGKTLGVERPEPKIRHSARYDAIAQAEWVIAINRMLLTRGVKYL